MKLLLFILMLGIILLVGCTSTISNQDLVNNSSRDALNDCFSKIVSSYGDSYVEYNKDVCRLSQAKETKDSRLCSDIKNENKAKECGDYFKELPFIQGTASREDILNKCECTHYCYGVKYKLECIFKNVQTPQQCLSFIGLHYDTDSEGTKIYLENANGCLKSLIERQEDFSFCDEYPDIYTEVCREIKEEEIAKEKEEIASSTMHVITDDQEVWIRSDMNKAKEIIEGWKKEGYLNFAIFNCKWSDQLEICIDYNALYREGKELECNYHKFTEEYGMEKISSFVGLIPSKWC